MMHRDPDEEHWLAEMQSRLERLRETSATARAPDELWHRIRASIAAGATVGGGHAGRPWPRAWIVATAAAALVAGFAVGRASAGPDAGAADGAGSASRPELLIQEHGTELVRAIDALGTGRAAAGPDARAQRREVTLKALGAILAAGSAEFPAEIDALLGATRPPVRVSP